MFSVLLYRVVFYFCTDVSEKYTAEGPLAFNSCDDPGGQHMTVANVK
jgi:hypothetical protein